MATVFEFSAPRTHREQILQILKAAQNFSRSGIDHEPNQSDGDRFQRAFPPIYLVRPAEKKAGQTEELVHPAKHDQQTESDAFDPKDFPRVPIVLGAAYCVD